MAILLFTGPSATGKTTIAKKVGENLGIPIIGEREILHQIANLHGFSRARHWIKEIGLDQALDETLKTTIQIIKEKREENIILDGSYDKRLPELLKNEIKDKQILVIAVMAMKEKREERITERMKIDHKEAKKEMQLIDNFKKYAGMEEFIKKADFVIENNHELTNSINKLESYLELKILNWPSGPERLRG